MILTIGHPTSKSSRSPCKTISPQAKATEEDSLKCLSLLMSGLPTTRRASKSGPSRCSDMQETSRMQPHTWLWSVFLPGSQEGVMDVLNVADSPIERGKTLHPDEKLFLFPLRVDIPTNGASTFETSPDTNSRPERLPTSPFFAQSRPSLYISHSVCQSCGAASSEKTKNTPIWILVLNQFMAAPSSFSSSIMIQHCNSHCGGNGGSRCSRAFLASRFVTSLVASRDSKLG